MKNTKTIRSLVLAGVLVSVVSLAGAQPWDVSYGQVNISGATLFKNFFPAPGSTNDYIDVDNNGLYSFMDPPLGAPAVEVDQLAKDWNDFSVAPPSTSWLVNYRGVGSGNGLKEMINFQAVQHATNYGWFPIADDGGTSNGNPYNKAGSAYGQLPTGTSSDDAMVNRKNYFDGSITWGGPYANGSGVPHKPYSVDLAVADVPSKWFATKGATADSWWSKKPAQDGYGKSPMKSWDSGQQSNELKSLTVTLENPSNPGQTEDVTFNTNTGAPDSLTIFDTEVAYVPMGIITNRRVDQRDWKMSELQVLFTTGRTPSGENLAACTRDSGSGTRNGSMNSLGIHPSWARGDNYGTKTKDKVDTPKLGPKHQTSNLGSSSIMAPVVSNNGLAVGYNGIESTVGKINAGKDLIEHARIMKDIAGGTQYVPINMSTLINNDSVNFGWQMGGMETFYSNGDPEALAHTPTTDAGQGVAPGLAGNGNSAMTNVEAALYLRNIVESIAAFTTDIGGDESQFMPGELLASQFFLRAGMDATPSGLDGATWVSNPSPNTELQNWAKVNHFLANNPPHGYGNLGAWVPQRMAHPTGTYDDGQVQDYAYEIKDGSGGYTTGTVAGKSQLNSANLVQADFDGDGARDLDDITKMVECYAYAGGILCWAADQQVTPDMSSLIMPHIIGDNNGDGNFDAADIRYACDGLVVISGALDRKAAFEAADDACVSNNFFGTVVPASIGGAYVRGYSFADLAGSDPSGRLFGAAPGAAPVGADGMLNGYDINYIQRVLAGYLYANEVGVTADDSDGDGKVDWSWDDIDEAIFMDLSADLNQDRYVDQDDVDYLVKTMLATEYGDANLDGKVDLNDLSILAGSWDSGGVWANGDFNGDGVVDLNDLSILAGGWGFGTAGVMAWDDALAATGVPEPATLGLLAVGAAALIRRRRA